MADSGEVFSPAWRRLVQEEEREMERESRATYRSGIDGHYSREISEGVTPARSVSREKRGNGGGDDADMRVPPGSDRERGKGYPFGIELGGLRAASPSGPKRFPGGPFIFLFSFFFSFFFVFLIYSPFSNLIQIDSNQLCKVSIIQNNNTEQ
jgi:hypothetical protein